MFRACNDNSRQFLGGIDTHARPRLQRCQGKGGRWCDWCDWLPLGQMGGLRSRPFIGGICLFNDHVEFIVRCTRYGEMLHLDQIHLK